MEERARLFAEKSHGRIDQRRKYTGERYIVHPAEVVKTLRSVPHTEAMICAAWLHDVVEDTGVTLQEVEREFGAEVASLVEMLTKPSCADDGNEERKRALNREHTARASREAKTIKLADIIDNTKTIFQRDPGFARGYIAEKILLLDVLKEGDPILFQRAKDQLDQYKDFL